MLACEISVHRVGPVIYSAGYEKYEQDEGTKTDDPDNPKEDSSEPFVFQ